MGNLALRSPLSSAGRFSCSLARLDSSMTGLHIVETLLGRALPRGARLVFDIDNTVADTRYRTLHVARAFDRLAGTDNFRELSLASVRLDGRTTAEELGLPAAVASAFHAYWCSDRGFWSGDCFVHDRRLEPVAALAQQAAGAGFEVVWLTGRIEALRGPTAGWLAAHGLSGTRLVCKPDLSVRTAAFKADYFASLRAPHEVGFFMTESAGDIAAVQARAPAVPCILVDFPYRESVSLDPATPVLPVELEGTLP
jgi:hypothetical protein